MKNLIILLIVFVLWFILGAGAGFKVLEGMSTDLVMNAFTTSATEFSEAYSGSSAQWTVAWYQVKLNALIEDQKNKVTEQIKNGILDYVKAKLGMWTGN